MIVGKNELCCGCTACKSICPKDAITMKPNKKGFQEPQIDPEKCVNCNLCEKVCGFSSRLTGLKGHETSTFFIAAKRIDDTLRMQSQSGGAFAAIAEYFCAMGGIVYGVTINDQLTVEYRRVDKKRDLRRLFGSKYVQAAVNDVFQYVKTDLVEGKAVLFSGTPCVVDGLKAFLRESRVEHSRLLSVDLVCHGVPSPKVYKDYIQLVSLLHGNKKVKKFDFRDKSFGWHGHTTTMNIKGRTFRSNDYVKIFYSHLELRDSCYVCPYTNLNRPGDITIGDCWGIEKIDSEFDDNKGVSLIILNSCAGKKVWSDIAKEFICKDVTKEQILQPNLQHPTEKPEETEAFWNDYGKYGCEYAFVRYCGCDHNQETEIIKTNQYIRRAGRKIKRLIYRFFM